MFRRKISVLIPVGVLALAAGMMVNHFARSRSSDIAGSFLMGGSVALVIAGVTRKSGEISR
jgi:hypothetical protein